MLQSLGSQVFVNDHILHGRETECAYLSLHRRIFGGLVCGKALALELLGRRRAGEVIEMDRGVLLSASIVMMELEMPSLLP